MDVRLDDELVLLRSTFPATERSGPWFLIPDYPVPAEWGWTPRPLRVAFHAQPQHPGQQPYGIYAPTDVRVRGNGPGNCAAASNRPPFPGEWSVLSWSPQSTEWRPKADVRAGSNLLTFALSFRDRFAEGT